MSDIQEDITKRVASMTPEQQADYMKFVETMHNLKPGEHMEVGPCVFWREMDGTISAMVPRELYQAYTKRFGPLGVTK